MIDRQTLWWASPPSTLGGSDGLVFKFEALHSSLLHYSSDGVGDFSITPSLFSMCDVKRHSTPIMNGFHRLTLTDSNLNSCLWLSVFVLVNSVQMQRMAHKSFHEAIQRRVIVVCWPPAAFVLISVIGIPSNRSEEVKFWKSQTSYHCVPLRSFKMGGEKSL